MVDTHHVLPYVSEALLRRRALDGFHTMRQSVNAWRQRPLDHAAAQFTVSLLDLQGILPLFYDCVFEHVPLPASMAFSSFLPCTYRSSPSDEDLWIVSIYFIRS